MKTGGIFFDIFLASIIVLSCVERDHTPIVNSKGDSLYTIKMAEQKMVVNTKGGRIISLQLNQVECLGPGGSTFWISPQSNWAWPPIKQHHEDEYKATVIGDTLVLKSKMDPLLRVQICKKIFVNKSDTSFRILYGITNAGDSLLSIAPWENTRTFKNTLLFYPKGNTDSMAHNPDFGKLILTKSDNINWFSYEPARIQGKSMGKLFADGSEGWIGGANNGLVLIKRFEDITPLQQAPGEGEIEIFSDHENSFMEMEQQGPYTLIKPGKTLWWEVRWILREVPEDIQVLEGNHELISYVKGLIEDNED